MQFVFISLQFHTSLILWPQSFSKDCLDTWMAWWTTGRRNTRLTSLPSSTVLNCTNLFPQIGKKAYRSVPILLIMSIPAWAYKGRSSRHNKSLLGTSSLTNIHVHTQAHASGCILHALFTCTYAISQVLLYASGECCFQVHHHVKQDARACMGCMPDWSSRFTSWVLNLVLLLWPEIYLREPLIS